MAGHAAAGLMLAAFLLGAESTVLAQQTSSGFDTFWIGGGIGAGSHDFAGQLNVSYQTGVNLFSFRTAGTAGIFSDGFSDVALLYGRATRAPSRTLASLSLGLAVVDGCRGEGLGGCLDRPSVIGFPVETQVSWRPAKFLGIGLYGFANINHWQSFAGVTLAIQLGRLR
jgi:hypothetical protein